MSELSRVINRELSWLEFNGRVLEEALDTQKLPLERLKFLAIFSSNLDEFFMVRISGLVSQTLSGYNTADVSGETPSALLVQCEHRIRELFTEQSRVCFKEIFPELAKAGLSLYDEKNLPKRIKVDLEKNFIKEIFPTLTPMAVDPGRPFPFLAGKNIHLLVELQKSIHPEKKVSLAADSTNSQKRFAIVPIPRDSRFIPVPGIEGGFIPREEIVRIFLPHLFKGYDIVNTSTFRLTRDGELSILEDEAVDLLATLQDELKRRDRGVPLRIEISADAPESHAAYLCEHLEFSLPFLFRCEGLIGLDDFFQWVGDPELRHLLPEEWEPVNDIGFETVGQSIFDVIKEKDRMLSLPFERFDPVVQLLNEASSDPNVLAIKQTLYRTSGNSPIVAALMRAAGNGKQVTVLVEIKARFDEQRNITWAREMEEAGCHVIYGLVGMKIHSKMLLVIRKEKEGICRYVHLSTGNYNDKTARLYTDISFFTAKPAFGQDVSEIFNLLTGYSDPPRWKKLVCSPLDMRNFFLTKIEREADNAKRGAEAHIVAKMNSLLDNKVIEALYAASQAGVKIELIVRGICCVRPGVPGLSDNIRVSSLIDRYLEHSRIFYFHEGGARELYLASADWMNRNFDRRVEVLFPIEEEEHRQELMDLLDIMRSDNTQMRDLLIDGRYVLRKPKSGELARRAQKELYDYNVKQNQKKKKSQKVKFIPVEGK